MVRRGGGLAVKRGGLSHDGKELNCWMGGGGWSGCRGEGGKGK